MTIPAGLPNAGTYFYMHDGLGSVRNLLDAAQAEQNRYDYEAFGQTVNTSTAEAVAQPFTFTGRRADPESGLLYYRYRQFDPRPGRFAGRDPLLFEGTINGDLYTYVGARPTNEVDPHGQWWPDTHETLTRNSMEQAFPRAKYGHDPCYDYILDRLIPANRNQDSGSAANELWRHYNRPIDNPPNSKMQQYNNLFRGYVAQELQAWQDNSGADNPTCNDCNAALDALGRVSHTWQDYYAHAVLTTNGEASPAWTATPPVTGSPDRMSRALKPSSWRGVFQPGEHGWSEPGGRGGELDPRTRDATSFVAGKLKSMLPDWFRKCRCCCTLRGP